MEALTRVVNLAKKAELEKQSEVEPDCSKMKRKRTVQSSRSNENKLC